MNLTDQYLLQEKTKCEQNYDYLFIYKAATYDYAGVLVDITLPVGNGLEIIKQLKNSTIKFDELFDDMVTAILIILILRFFFNKVVSLLICFGNHFIKLLPV